MDEIEITVLDILKKILRNEKVTSSSPLIGSGGIMDSLTAVQFITQIEQYFHISIADRDITLEAFSNVKTLSKLIAEC